MPPNGAPRSATRTHDGKNATAHIEDTECKRATAHIEVPVPKLLILYIKCLPRATTIDAQARD